MMLIKDFGKVQGTHILSIIIKKKAAEAAFLIVLYIV